MVVNVFLDRLDAAHTQSLALSDIDPCADPLTLATITSIAGIAEIDRGELHVARQRFEKATAQIERSESAYGHVWVAVLFACTAIGRAHPRDAAERLAETRRRVVPDVGEDANLVATLDFVRARALLDLGDAQTALALVRRNLDQANHHGIIATFEQGMSAAISFWNDAPDDAIPTKLLDRVAFSYSPRAQGLLAASKVRRLLHLNRYGDAMAVAASNGIGSRQAASNDASSQDMHERGEWLLARLELEVAHGNCQGVLDAMEAHLKAARANERHRDQIELLLIAADAHQRLNQTKAALRSLSLALSVAAPGQVLHPFMAKQALVEQLFAATDGRRLGMSSDQEREFVERIRAHSTTSGAESNTTLSGVPTMREIQLLSLLDQGLNNEQVADRLSLSVATVKWHLHNVYEKLGVSSRSAAIARTRALNLMR
ncbi:MAG: LuxR C-terminal-related transcriptional regulator [Rudaea sp.]